MGARFLSFFLLVCLSLSIEASAKNISHAQSHRCLSGNHPICQDLITLKPSLGYDSALELSNSFYRISKKYQLDPRMLVSIAYQESSLELGAVRKVSGYNMSKSAGYAEVTIGSDFCMMQINYHNIRAYELDIERLLSDVAYCVESGAMILKSFEKRFGKLEEYWWTRYNSCTPAYREMYQKLVTKHWTKILPPPDTRTCKTDTPAQRYIDEL